jgi:hypothetical protein
MFDIEPLTLAFGGLILLSIVAWVAIVLIWFGGGLC